MNALAGGGTFAVMPTLVALGLPTPIANATSIAALQPAASASAWAYRRDLVPLGKLSVRGLVAITFAGGLAGSVLLTVTPTHVFDLVVPWLLLIATLMLLFGRRAAAALQARVRIGIGTAVAAQTLLAVYCGYFGGGVGLMMIAVWGLLASIEPHAVNPARTLMLATANLAAMAVFAATGLIAWRWGVPMALGAIVGGYWGAHGARRLPPRAVRIWTILVSVATTAVFFARAYG